MELDMTYLAVVFNSTIRLMTPILFVSLGSALCNRALIFNIGLEGMMLTGAFAAIVANFFTGSVILSILAACLSASIVALVAGVFMVKLKGAMLVVGVSINVLMTGLTTFLMQIIWGVKGAFTGTQEVKLIGLPKVNVDWLKGSPTLYTMFSSLTYLDYAVFVIAIVLYIFLFKSVAGFRLRSVGINKEAAQSMGVKADRIQIMVVVFSGFLSGLGGCLLTMGGVTLFTQSITSGRGFIAMAAGTLGGAHPIGVIFSSAFFGFAQSLSYLLQNSEISSQLTMAIPYAATIVGLAGYNYINIINRKTKEI